MSNLFNEKVTQDGNHWNAEAGPWGSVRAKDTEDKARQSLADQIAGKCDHPQLDEAQDHGEFHVPEGCGKPLVDWLGKNGISAVLAGTISDESPKNPGFEIVRVKHDHTRAVELFKAELERLVPDQTPNP